MDADTCYLARDGRNVRAREGVMDGALPVAQHAAVKEMIELFRVESTESSIPRKQTPALMEPFREKGEVKE